MHLSFDDAADESTRYKAAVRNHNNWIVVRQCLFALHLPLAMMRAGRMGSLRCAKVSVVTLWNCHQKEVSVLSVGTKNAAAVAADAEKKCRTVLEHTQTMLSFGECC